MWGILIGFLFGAYTIFLIFQRRFDEYSDMWLAIIFFSLFFLAERKRFGKKIIAKLSSSELINEIQSNINILEQFIYFAIGTWFILILLFSISGGGYLLY